MPDSRRKGRRFENEVVGYLRANGYHAERISEAEEEATMWPKLHLNGATPSGGEQPPL